MKILGLIPARGGSKGIPNKCIAPCADKPLLFYTVHEAKKSRSLNRVILSTDSPLIADVGRGLGIDVPYIRPGELAQDDTPMIRVMQHALDWMHKAGDPYDAIVLLQPTSPLRKAQHIDEAVELFQQSKAQSVVSVTAVPHQFSPGSVMELRDGRLTSFLNNAPVYTRRQDMPVLYARNGPAILVTRADVIQQGRLYGDANYGYVMSPEVSYDIDSSADLELISILLKARRSI